MLSKNCSRHVIETIISLYPDAEPILNFKNPYELLIAVMLSAQTTDVRVNMVTPELFAKYPDPEQLAQASPAEVEKYINSLGLYKNKSKYAVGIAQKLINDYGGQVPQTRKELMTLPSVGRKSANVVLSVAFNIPAFAVDTHIARVCKHHKIAEANWDVRQIEDRVTECIPASLWRQAHMAMILFGREICHPRNPECENYPELYICQEEA